VTAPLDRRALEGVAQFLLGMALLLFLPAWSLRYWQGWLLLALFAASVLAITAWFLKKDPALIERRLRAGAGAEKERSQKTIQTMASLALILLVAFPGLDRHFGLSSLSWPFVLFGDALVLLGFAIVFRVFQENSYTSATIEVGSGQSVVATGPYALVRHPMYAGSLLLALGIPLGLGSLWGLVFWLPFAATILWRLIDEERYLIIHLAGYDAYRRAVHRRLVPGIY
jgi:protein-S-isoprenylcysteine O-methyltransferase Ste14